MLRQLRCSRLSCIGITGFVCEADCVKLFAEGLCAVIPIYLSGR